jgi:hypothetical protein
MQVSTRLTNALGLELPPTTLFHHPTPAALAIELASRQHAQDVASLAAELQELPEGEVARMLRKASGSDA